MGKLPGGDPEGVMGCMMLMMALMLVALLYVVFFR